MSEWRWEIVSPDPERHILNDGRVELSLYGDLVCIEHITPGFGGQCYHPPERSRIYVPLDAFKELDKSTVLR